VQDSVSTVKSSQDGVWGPWTPKFQVIAHAYIDIKSPPDQYQYEGRAHSLWYCDAQEPAVFRWYETAFMIHALVPKRARQTPFALPPGEEAGKAVSPGMAEFAVAWPFTPIEPGNEDEFLERWIGWFAKAAQGGLGYPSAMPEKNPNGSWRR
jgi:hypothetical protein